MRNDGARSFSVFWEVGFIIAAGKEAAHLGLLLTTNYHNVKRPVPTHWELDVQRRQSNDGHLWNKQTI